MFGYDPAYYRTGAGEASDFLATDLEALDCVEEHLRAAGSAQVRPTLGVPVHASTLQRRASRLCFMRRLDQLPAAHARRLSVRISEIPRGAPISAIADWVGHLRGKVRTVLLQFHHSEPAPLQIEQTGAGGAGFSLPRQSEAAAGQLNLGIHVRSWAAKLAQARMIFFLDDVPGEAWARPAHELGVTFLTSNQLWPCVEAPGPIRHARLRERFAR
jgi:hypothetical protein